MNRLLDIVTHTKNIESRKAHARMRDRLCAPRPQSRAHHLHQADGEKSTKIFVQSYSGITRTAAGTEALKREEESQLDIQRPYQTHMSPKVPGRQSVYLPAHKKVYNLPSEIEFRRRILRT